MIGWPLFYAALTAAMLWSAFASKDSDAKGAAIVLSCGWLLTGLLDYVISPDDGIYFPFMDGLLGILFLTVAYRTKSIWLLTIASIFAWMVWRHVAFFSDPSASHYNYDRDLNIGYALQVLIVIYESVRAKRAVTA